MGTWRAWAAQRPFKSDSAQQEARGLNLAPLGQPMLFWITLGV